MMDQENNFFADKRTALAMLLCLIVVMVYSEYMFAPYNRPATTPQDAASVVNQSGAAQQINASQSTPGVANSVESGVVAAQPRVGSPSVVELNQSAKIKIENEKILASFVSLGGRIQSLKLKGYTKTKGGDELYEMISVEEGRPLPLGVYAGPVNDNFVDYKVQSVFGGLQKEDVYKAVGGDVVLTLVGKLSNGTGITKTVTIKPDSYLFDVAVKLDGETADGSRLKLEWSYFEANLSKLSSYDFHGMERLSAGSVTKTPFASFVDGSEVPGSDSWIMLGDKYFMSTLIPVVSGQNTNASRIGSTFSVKASGETNRGEFKIFVGPKEFYTLKAIGYDLQKAIDLGVFSVLAHPLLDLIRFFHRMLGNWGLAIILLTLMIKTAFLPLTKKSFESMAAMQVVQPKIKALREKYQADPNKLNAELIALYKREGINPMGGCLPMLIQLPVFLGLYNALLNSIELRHAPFALWINDLSAPESLNLFGFGIPVMVILMGISMFVQQWTMPSTMDPMQKKIMMFMPIIFTFFFIGFPAGLVLYWLVNNVVSIVQQAFIRKERFIGATRATLLAGVSIFGLSYVLVLFS
jgi:YidC/Oxa1 family membrane protein insertase